MPNGRAVFKVSKGARHRDKPSEKKFTLATIRSEGQFNSIIYEERDSYREVDTRWSVLMNAEDIDALGRKPGDLATLRSAYGVMADVVIYQFDLPRGSLLAYYPEANLLTGQEVDPRSKTPAFKSTQVDVE